MQITDPEDYNWKFPQRTNTMYLSTIEKVERRPATSCAKNTLNVSDIEGAQPKFVTQKSVNK
jgi:hypothetical protein